MNTNTYSNCTPAARNIMLSGIFLLLLIMAVAWIIILLLEILVPHTTIPAGELQVLAQTIIYNL